MKREEITGKKVKWNGKERVRQFHERGQDVQDGNQRHGIGKWAHKGRGGDGRFQITY